MTDRREEMPVVRLTKGDSARSDKSEPPSAAIIWCLVGAATRPTRDAPTKPR